MASPSGRDSGVISAGTAAVKGTLYGPNNVGGRSPACTGYTVANITPNGFSCVDNHPTTTASNTTTTGVTRVMPNRTTLFTKDNIAKM
eukprot:m.27493 g.27493  ORF g.27493 m.27493 type:complete len:88 (+) comp15758_c0_seq1:924-1187(+)